MAKTTKAPVKEEKKEVTYIIPIREKCRSVPSYKKTNKAVRSVKEFLARHMKVRDRDLNKIKLDSYLNEFLWARGIKNPPHKVKVKAYKDGELIKVELAELPKKLADKKAKKDKIENAAMEVVKKKKQEAKKDEAKEEPKGPEEKPADGEEKKAEEKEKKAAVVEAGQEMEKAAAKQIKHTAKGSEKSPVVQRKALSR